LALALVTAYAGLGFAWAMTNAPFSAPDESQHYLRAVGIGNGHLVGAPTVYDGPVLSAKETAWRHLLTRAVTVPAGLSPVGYECELFHPDRTFACSDRARPNRAGVTEQTDVGIYQPEPYLLPALAVRLDHHPQGALRDGRLAMLAVWLALLSLSVWSLWDAETGAMSVLGLILAITPMVVFMGSSLTDSSLEIVASLSFFATLVGLRRSDSKRPWRWAAVGITGVVLALSRSLGPLWVASGILLIWVVGSPVAASGETWRGANLPFVRWPRLRGPAGAVAGLLIAAAVALDALWVHTYGPHVSLTLVPGLSALHDGASQLRSAWEGVIGVFGYEDVPVGRLAVAVWTVLDLITVGLAFRVATRRERTGLVLGLALIVAVPIYLYAAVTSAEGIQTQGRHILPLVVLTPLLAGEILRRHPAALAPAIRRWLFPSTATIVVLVQLLAWWENSRRYAVGLHGPWWFESSAVWSPPAGWTFWIALMIALASCALAGAVLATRSGPRATSGWESPANPRLGVTDPPGDPSREASAQPGYPRTS
jgi:hypothetical protein